MFPDNGQQVFTFTSLFKHLSTGGLGDHVERHDARSTPVSERQVVDVLVEKGHVIYYAFADVYRGGARYVRPNASPYEVLKSLRPRGYLSHGSAARLHGLLPNDSPVVYWNDEQTPKPRPTGKLTQGRIDAAFSRPSRTSNHRAAFDGYTFCILSGMSTGRLGTVPHRLPNGFTFDVTSVERTLIDVAVRPAYAGGPRQVLECYRAALGRVDVGSLADTLTKLNYIYPYHQAIGFYMDRVGFERNALDRFRAERRDFNFYLDYQMDRPAIDAAWRVYHPRDLRLSHRCSGFTP